MADVVALGLIKTPLLYKRFVSFVLDFISWSLVNANYFSDDKSSKKEMKSCIQARTTHVVKLTYLFTKFAVMGMGFMIVHSLFNALLVQKSNVQNNSS
jgi:hypothetical protein